MPSGPRLDKPPLVDRSDGLITIARLVDGLERRESGLLVIEGVAGVGRSALLDHAVDLARQRGIRVLGGSGAAVEHVVAFGLGRQLFEPVLAGGAPEDRELLGNSPPLWLLDSSQRLADSEQRDSESLLEDFHRLFLLLGRLATKQPLLLALDDLHHADGLSLRWLAYLVRRLAGLPILVAATTRLIGNAGPPPPTEPPQVLPSCWLPRRPRTQRGWRGCS